MHLDLQFIKSWGAYNVGEVARFAKQQAHALIERGVALDRAAVGDVENAVAAALGGKAPTGTDAPQASGTDSIKGSSKAKPSGSNAANSAGTD